MDKVFVDTSFFIALLNSRDADHPHAVKLQEELASLKTRKTTSRVGRATSFLLPDIH